MLGTTLFFALTAGISKWLGKDYPTLELVFFRNIIGVLFIWLSIRSRPIERKAGGKLGLLIFRGVVGTLSLYMFFYSIQVLGLGHAATYQYTYPIFLALLSWLFLGERLKIPEWLAIFIGFVGILFVFRPDLDVPAGEHILGLGVAILTAVSYLSIRRLGQYYDVRTIILSFMLSGILMPLLSMVIGESFPEIEDNFLVGHFILPHTTYHWLGFLALGITAYLGQKMLTQAFTYDKAGRIAAIGYSNILFSTILGILMGESLPSTAMVIGMLLIIFGGVLIALTKSKS
ncbi:putative membrane protein [Dyadobacter jejuensis]|uniref:Putative membrane protein n=2 Tax=Dyadobacter jejuensis TaxID=1082580 RepID=A0A316AQN6_9BACT|nr:putative membrane protein [Dyadobacter jejuensis]